MADILRFPADGSYYLVNATGQLLDLPTASDTVRLVVSDASVYFKIGGSSLALADCVIPTLNADPCSSYLPNSFIYDVKITNNSKIAIKSASGTAKVWLFPVEGSN